MNCCAFGEKWLVRKRTILRPFDKEEARRRHSNREPYVALVDENGTLRVIEVVPGWVSVRFLDAERRTWLMYSFEDVGGGRLFLRGATYWSYDDMTGDIVEKVLFSFKDDGRIVMSRMDSRSGAVADSEAMGDMQANWDLYPDFEKYDALCVENRVSSP